MAHLGRSKRIGLNFSEKQELDLICMVNIEHTRTKSLHVKNYHGLRSNQLVFKMFYLLVSRLSE